MKRALILCGGWPGHDPVAVAGRFRGLLEARGCAVETIGSTEPFADAGFLRGLDLLVPVWSYAGTPALPDDYAVHIADAVSDGMGIAGCHGGMCDAFRESVLWQFLTGAQWVAHPSNPFYHCTPCVPSPEGAFLREYTVHIEDVDSPITRGLRDFRVRSEQYYLHVDPAVRVLATTRFVREGDEYAPHLTDGPVTMPVAYARRWGRGRIFYSSLGHCDAEFDRFPEALTLMCRGLLWALGEDPE